MVGPGAAGGCAGVAQGRGGWGQDAGGAHCGGEVGAEGVSVKRGEGRERVWLHRGQELHVKDPQLREGSCA